MRYVLLAAALLLFPAQDDEIDEWIEQLGDSDLTTREEAIQNLTKAGKKAVPRLKAALKHKSKDVRLRAQLILDDLPPEFTFVKLLNSKERFALSPDGTLLVYFTDKGKVEAVSTKGWKSRFSVVTMGMRLRRGQAWARSAPAFTPDSRKVFVQLDGEGFALLDLETGKQTGKIDFEWSRHPGRLTGKPCTLSTFGERHAYVNTPTVPYLHLMREDKGGRLYDMPSEDVILTDPEGKLMLGYSEGEERGLIHVYAAKSYKMTTEVGVKDRQAWMAAPRNLSRLYLGSKTDGMLGVYETNMLGEVVRKKIQEPRMSHLAVRADGKWLVVCGQDKKVRIFGAQDLNLLATVEFDAVPKYAEVSRDGSVLAVQAGGEIHVLRRK